MKDKNLVMQGPLEELIAKEDLENMIQMAHIYIKISEALPQDQKRSFKRFYSEIQQYSFLKQKQLIDDVSARISEGRELDFNYLGYIANDLIKAHMVLPSRFKQGPQLEESQAFITKHFFEQYFNPQTKNIYN